MKFLRGILVGIVVFSACARKNTQLFMFEEKETPSKGIDLKLPAPQKVQVVRKKNEVVVTWQSLDKKDLPHDLEDSFLGYQVYRCSSNSFLTGLSRNRDLLVAPYFQDALSKNEVRNNYFYAVRAVFLIHNERKMGPLSALCRVQSNEKGFK
jgi:hypothetical protein